ncbi:MAG: alpha/beta hydrolase, partial [Flavobacteriales bacterium]|nr:alpha/beta hydrolase [Flavobacteriales bacterium]
AFGSARTHRNFVSHLCQATRAHAYVPNYSLTPETRYPVALEECHAAYQEVRKRHPEASIIFTGDSAGGNLCSALTIKLHRESSQLPDALMLMSPWLDLRHNSRSAEQNFNRDSVFERQDLINYSDLYCEDKEDPLVSPLLAEDLSFFPPTLLQAARNELLFPDSKDFAEKLDEAGVDVYFETENNLFHSWQIFPEHIDSARTSIESMGLFAQSIAEDKKKEV